jgi:hypothetical protein
MSDIKATYESPLTEEHIELLRAVFDQIKEDIPAITEMMIFGNTANEMVFDAHLSTGNGLVEQGNQYFMVTRSEEGSAEAVGMDRGKLEEKYGKMGDGVFSPYSIEEISEDQYWELFGDDYTNVVS